MCAVRAATAQVTQVPMMGHQEATGVTREEASPDRPFVVHMGCRRGCRVCTLGTLLPGTYVSLPPWGTLSVVLVLQRSDAGLFFCSLCLFVLPTISLLLL